MILHETSAATAPGPVRTPVPAPRRRPVQIGFYFATLTLATGLFFLAILLGETMIDYVSKDFTPMPRQIEESSVIKH